MKALLLSLLLPTLMGLPAGVSAQYRTCQTFEVTDREKIEIQARTRQRLRRVRSRSSSAWTGELKGAIPVAFHVIHDGETGKVTQSQIDDQIEVLNAAYAPISFVLAQVDYTDDPYWFHMKLFTRAEWNCKRALSVDPDYYLNVYTCDPGRQLLGWAIFPYLAEYIPAIDGATVLYSSLPGGKEPGHDQGDTLVHEIGHWAGLFHTFQGRCGQLGDMVSDTPSERSPAYGCEPGRDTCRRTPGLDPIDNFMDYSNDACATRFTPGQFDRMTTSLAAFRPVIWDLLAHGSSETR